MHLYKSISTQMNTILRRIKKVKYFGCISVLKLNLHIASVLFASAEDSKKQIFQTISKPVAYSHNKVSIIGIGQVGIAIAVGLVSKNVTSHIALFDTNEKLVQGEALDLLHGSCFLNSPKVEAGTNSSVLQQSRVCVLTTGETPTEASTDMCAIAKKNAAILVSIVPKIFEASPDCVLVVATRPIEAMVYVCSKIMSNIPKNKIIGVGCSLDTMRLKHFMAKRYCVDVDSCNGLVIGQNGSGSVVLWSTLSVCGNRLCSVNPNIGTDCDPEDWKSVHQKVIEADYKLWKGTGTCICWAPACNIVDIVEGILSNSRKVFSLSVPGKGFYGICTDLHVSLPCVLGEQGVSDIMTIKITDNENAALIKSLECLEELQKSTCV